MSVEPNTPKAFVDGEYIDNDDGYLLKADAMFGFTLTFVRVLNDLISGYPAVSHRLPFSPRVGALAGLAKAI